MKFSIPEDIIIPFNQGDQEAFRKIYDELYPFIYAYTHRMIPSAAGWDIAADSFIKLYQHRGGFENLQRIKSFLFQTAKNASLDYLKHERLERKKAREIRESVMDENIVEAAEYRADLLQLVFRAMERLPRRCRHIFRLYYAEGLTDTEIARRLGISEKTVDNQKSIALKILKLKLNKMKIITIPLFMAASCHLASLLHFCRF